MMGEGVEERDGQTLGVHVVYPPEQWKALVEAAGLVLLKEFRFCEQHNQHTSIEYLITAWRRPGLLDASTPQRRDKVVAPGSTPQLDAGAWSAAALEEEEEEEEEQPAPPSRTPSDDGGDDHRVSDRLVPSTLRQSSPTLTSTLIRLADTVHGRRR